MLTGRIAPLAGDPPAGFDTVTARRYRQPVLGDRPVVRLTTGMLAEAEDLTSEFFGFDKPERVRTVGVARRVALGFPAWALVNDPDNAHHAVALVKDLERLAALARFKPGLAATELAGVAGRLDKAAPQLLPSCYEQAGRLFLREHNVKLAGTMFARAREAERVHALDVDPEQLRDVFVEFGLAGALTAKDLSGYAKSLRSADGYDLFWSVCRRWLGGGRLPYAAIVGDIRKLAKAGNKNVRDAVDDLLRLVIASPTADRVARGFWSTHRDAIVALAKSDPAVRGQLLAFYPAAEYVFDYTDIAAMWIDMLTASGATAGLVEPAGSVPAQAEPPQGPAHWLVGLLRLAGRERFMYDCAPLLDLVVAMAPRLRADGVGVDLHWHSRRPDLDMADLLVAHGIPIEDFSGYYLFDEWLARATRRDLAALASDERGVAKLRKMVDDYLTPRVSAATLQQILDTPGLRMAAVSWLDKAADAMSDGGLYGLESQMRRVVELPSPEVLGLSPAAAERIASIDIAGRLAATLRGGLLDELGWPALDDAIGAVSGVVTIVGEGWPVLVVRHGEQLICVGPDRVVLEHTLRIPAKYRPSHGFEPRASYVDGRLFVWWDGPKRQLAYWSDEPDKILPVRIPSYYGDPVAMVSLPAPDGGRFVGDGVLAPGGTAMPTRSRVHGDGKTLWKVQKGSWTPAPPSFVDGHDPGRSWMLPVVAGTAGSLLGSAGGVHGWRLREDSDGWLGEGIDGRQIRFAANGNHVPLAMLTLPGRDEPLVVAPCRPDRLELFDTAGRRVLRVDLGNSRPPLARGTRLALPLEWLHMLRVRDEAGSLALRKITGETAKALLEAEDLPAAVARLLPEITHPALIQGVTGVVRVAADCRSAAEECRTLAANVPKPRPVPADDESPAPVSAPPAKRGPMPRLPEAAAELADRVGLTTAEAAVVLAGISGADVRTALGLSAAHAEAANRSLGRRNNPAVEAVRQAAIGAEPERLWTDGPDVAAAADEWIRRFGRRTPVDLDTLAGAAGVSLLLIDEMASERGWRPDRTLRPHKVVDLVTAIRWLAYQLPIDGPLRRRLPEALAAVRGWLSDPESRLKVGYTWKRKRMLSLLRLPSASSGETVIEDWLQVQVSEHSVEVAVRPSAYRAEHRTTLDAVCALLEERVPDLGFLDRLDVRFEEPPAGVGYLQNPAITVPDLVEKVGLEPDAAVLYLQLLAMPDPTDANVARWNGWTPARLKAARTTLAATDLVRTAKRSRAGRTLFLPGGWADFRSPRRPVETWKLPLLAVEPLVLPVGTVADCFRAAWQRVEAGDRPTYEELSTD